MWETLIVCGTEELGSCQFGHLVLLVKHLLNNLVVLSTFLATGAFAWAGFLLLKSGGNTSARDKAKDIFKKVIIGYLWILAAWLIVYTITSVLLNPGFSLLTAP